MDPDALVPRSNDDRHGTDQGRKRSPALLCLAVACGILAVVPPASAQTLKELLNLARKNAPALAVSQAAVARAEEAFLEARAALEPTLDLSASYVQNSEAPKAVIQLPGSPRRQVIDLGSANVLEVRTDARYTLYSGGQSRTLIGAADAARRSQVLNRDQADQDLVLRVSRAFYQCLAAERLEAAAAEAVASARAHLATSATRVRAGAAPRLDSLRAEVDFSGRTTALLRAQQATKLSRVELETEVGTPLDTTRALLAPGGTPATIPDEAGAVEAALRARPELAGYDEGLRELDLRARAERAARRPRLTLSATAEYLGPNQLGSYLNLSDPGLKTYKAYVGAAMSLPLLDGGVTDARVGQILADRAALAARKADAALSIRHEVATALSDLQVALAALRSDTARITAAREALRIAEEAYKGGAGPATDVRDAESVLADARAEEAQSFMDAWVARAALDHATGGALLKEGS